MGRTLDEEPCRSGDDESKAAMKLKIYVESIIDWGEHEVIKVP